MQFGAEHANKSFSVSSPFQIYCAAFLNVYFVLVRLYFLVVEPPKQGTACAAFGHGSYWFGRHSSHNNKTRWLHLLVRTIGGFTSQPRKAENGLNNLTYTTEVVGWCVCSLIAREHIHRFLPNLVCLFLENKNRIRVKTAEISVLRSIPVVFSVHPKLSML
jgi:hypothetical protein